MEIKIKHIIIVIVIFTIGILSFIIIRRKNRNNSQNSENLNLDRSRDVIGSDISDYLELIKIYDEEYLKGGENSFILGYTLAQKNGNWDNLPLSEKFREKYNEKDGILGDIKYDNIEYRPYAGSDDNYYFRDYYTYFVITQGLGKTAYIYNTVYQEKGYLLDDVSIIETIKITDSDGNYISINGHSIDKDNFYSCFYSLCRGGDDELSVAVNPSFHAKYPFFLDIFEHYSPLRFNHIEFVPERSSWEHKEAYFIVDSVLECKRRNYKVNFILDSKGYLDDVNVIKVNEEEYEGDNENRSVKLLYTNSNWQNLEITENYREKHNGISYNNDINNIDIDYETQEKLVEEKNYNEYLRLYRMKDNTTSVYYIKYITDDQGYIDDIECTKLNYDNVPIEEAKELYLKEHSK